MSRAYIRGVEPNLTEAEITFDKFHAVKLVNDAVDQVRRAESRDRGRMGEAASTCRFGRYARGQPWASANYTS
jgi:transposase